MLRKTISVLAFIAILLTFSASASAYSTPFEVTPQGELPKTPNTAATANFLLREGGLYMYCNNPERIFPADMGKALMIEHNVKGEVFFTNENQCQVDGGFYLGLQLRNNSGEDITVTVKNIGYQVGGDWQGQREWTDFFQTEFELQPEASGEYAFKNALKPQKFDGATYIIPNGKYIYLMGGTTVDAYENINVGGTANRHVTKGQCVNGVVFFDVETEKDGVDVAFVCYSSSLAPVKSDSQQGYVVDRGGESFGRQYLGTAPYLCVNGSLAWDINDDLSEGARLPVKYDTVYYGNTAAYGVYGEYQNPKTKQNSLTVWRTNLNPESDNSFIGKDMMPFYCVTANGGKEVVIDVEHNDGTGKPANIGNWMTVYEETVTIKNSGTRPRSFALSMDIHGVVAVNVRDGKGDLIRSVYHAASGVPYYNMIVMAGETVTVTSEYVLLANCYGNLTHHVTASTAVLSSVLGDSNGDGSVSSRDYGLLKRHCLGTYTLEGQQKLASDIDGNGKINAKDYALLKRHCLGTYSISE